MDLTILGYDIVFDPLLPLTLISGFGIGTLILLILSLGVRHKSAWSRLIASTILGLILLNPVFIEAEKNPLPGHVLVAIDTSSSQTFGGRPELIDQARNEITARLENRDDIIFDIVDVGRYHAGQTLIYEDIAEALRPIPREQRAGIILITDGQIHDAPESALFEDIPLHVFLTGQQGEYDLFIEALSLPAFGIVGQSVEARIRLEQMPGTRRARLLPVTLSHNGKALETREIETGSEASFTLPIDHAGESVFEISVPAQEGEFTSANNTTAIIVNGVRDRLKVLLVSGQPHMGGRVWRNLLKSDPSIDLIHFTILRQPGKQDNVPQDELSLIPFPFQELFEEKIYGFDLIIFDRYTLNQILPPQYFENIAAYVREGGAFLDVSGPEFSSENSIATTALASILPSTPIELREGTYAPALTRLGQSHPVTQPISESLQTAGAWQRVNIVRPINMKDEILMQTPSGDPLLIIGGRDEGRVAQLTSDHIWLWARGNDGGGPHRPLLRNLVHWLMKEPALESRALNMRAEDQTLFIQARLSADDPKDPRMILTQPNGSQIEIPLQPEEGQDTLFSAKVNADQVGVYKAVLDDLSATAYAGDRGGVEFTDLTTSDDVPETLIRNAQGGSITWLGEDSVPNIDVRDARQRLSGPGWIGVLKSRAYDIESLKSAPIIAPLIGLGLLLLTLMLCWLRESGR